MFKYQFSTTATLDYCFHCHHAQELLIIHFLQFIDQNTSNELS